MRKTALFRNFAILFTTQLSWASALCAFEQSSYYIFDLVESETTEPTLGRIPVLASAMTTEGIEATNSVPQEHGEFQLDFTQTTLTSPSSGFELTVPIEKESDSLKFSTESFDLGTNTSVFGD